MMKCLLQRRFDLTCSVLLHVEDLGLHIFLYAEDKIQTAQISVVVLYGKVVKLFFCSCIIVDKCKRETCETDFMVVLELSLNEINERYHLSQQDLVCIEV